MRIFEMKDTQMKDTDTYLLKVNGEELHLIQELIDKEDNELMEFLFDSVRAGKSSEELAEQLKRKELLSSLCCFNIHVL